MENKDALEKLRLDFSDEIKGFFHYIVMSSKAEEAHMDQGYHVLRDIAKEEYIHAKHLRSILVDHNIWMPEDEKLWLDATAKYEMI